MSSEAKAEAGAGSPSYAVAPLERESAEVATDRAAERAWDGEEDELEDDLEEGDHALCVPEELEGRLSLSSPAAVGGMSMHWAAREEAEDSGLGARLQGRPLGELPEGLAAFAVPATATSPALLRPGAAAAAGAGPSPDPLSNVLQWMEKTEVDEASPARRAARSSHGSLGRGVAGNGTRAAGLLLGRHGISCIGENARGGSSDLSFGSEGESYPDVPSEVQDQNEQSCPGIPSDEEMRPRPPPYAAHVALIRWSDKSHDIPPGEDDLPRMPPPRSDGSTTGAAAALPARCAPRAAPPVIVDREEDEWMARKKLTGAIGRLVHYREGQRPAEDILGLCRTRYGRIKVTALRHNGTAQSAGIEVGDQLISIDGQRPSDHRMAESIRTSIKAPSTLIFMGFAGKLQAEVRVRQPDEPRCGLPHFADVASAARDRRTCSHVELCDPVVFQMPATSLLLEVDGPPPAQSPRRPSLPPPDPPAAQTPRVAPGTQLPSGLDTAAVPRPTTMPEEAAAARAISRVYELQREEAKHLVRRALRSGAPFGV